MFSGIFSFFFSSTPKVSQLIEKFNRTKIASCILSLSKTNYFKFNNILHSTLLLIDTNQEFEDEERGYGILIEYGDYSRDMTEEEKKNVKNGKVIYRYGEKGGLRYYAINYSNYLKEFGNIGYIDMDIDRDQMTFLNFIDQCAPLNENQWIRERYSLLGNNSHTFIIKALKILKPEFRSHDIQIGEYSKNIKRKIDILPEDIKKVLIDISHPELKTVPQAIHKQNKTDNLNKMINKNNDEDYKNKYEILNKIAKGGYGEVYKGKIKKTGELRAIKYINKENIKESLRNEYNSIDIEGTFNEFQKKLLDEIKYMEICSKNNTNDNSIKYYEYYNTNENLIIVMELCDTNLQFLLNERKNGFNVEKIRDILNQLNNTFKIMKDNKIIHRDLKLANILIKYEDNNKKKFIVKLTDYGISKQLSSMSKCFTHTGTLLTMAPEILNEEEYNSKCDLWSLGVIIYQLFFKEYPFNGNTETALLKKINNGQKFLRKTNDSKLDDLIRKLLIKDPIERYTWEQYLTDEFFSNK